MVPPGNDQGHEKYFAFLNFRHIQMQTTWFKMSISIPHCNNTKLWKGGSQGVNIYARNCMSHLVMPQKKEKNEQPVS